MRIRALLVGAALASAAQAWAQRIAPIEAPLHPAANPVGTASGGVVGPAAPFGIPAVMGLGLGSSLPVGFAAPAPLERGLTAAAGAPVVAVVKDIPNFSNVGNAGNILALQVNQAVIRTAEQLPSRSPLSGTNVRFSRSDAASPLASRGGREDGRLFFDGSARAGGETATLARGWAWRLRRWAAPFQRRVEGGIVPRLIARPAGASSSLGRANFDFGDEAAPPWGVLERWLSDELRLGLVPGRTEEWARETAQILRSAPTLNFEKAAARTFGKVHGLPAKALADIEALLSGKPIADLPDLKTFRLKALGGHVYAFTQSSGLFLKDNRGWTLLLPEVHEQWGIEEYDGKLLVGDGKSVIEVDGARTKVILQGVRNFGPITVHQGKTYLHERGSTLLQLRAPGDWRRIRGPGPGILDSTVSDGRFFVGTENGIFRRAGEDWKLVVAGGNWLRLVAHAGRLFARDSEGKIYEIKGGVPKPLLTEHGRGYDLFTHAGRMYAMAGGSAFFELRNGVWERLIPEAGAIWEWVAHGEELYVNTTQGLYHAKDGVWRRISETAGHFGEVIERGGKRFAATETGVYEIKSDRLIPVLPGLHIRGVAQEESGLLLATDAGVLRWPDLLAGLAAPWRDRFLGDIERRLSDSPGPPLPAVASDPFHLKEDGSAVVGEDGRSIFNGLAGTVASYFGRMSRGFGDAAVDSWPILERWLSDQLRLGLVPGRTEDWARETAQILRSTPELDFDKAAARALGTVHGLPVQALADVEVLLTGGPIADLPGPQTLRIQTLGGHVYAFTEKGLFLREGKGWTFLLPEVHKGWGIAEHDGKLLVGDGTSVFEVDGARTRIIIQGVPKTEYQGKTIFQLQVSDLSLWKRFWGPGPDILWRQAAFGEISFERGGKRFAMTGDFYEIQSDRWTAVFPDLHIHDVIQEADGLLLATDAGVLRWPDRPAGLAADWRKRLLGDIQRRLSDSPEPLLPATASDPFQLEEDGSAVVGEDGRSIFNGLAGTVASYFGRMGFGFGDAVAAAPNADSSGVWSSIEEHVLAAIRVQKTGKPDDWSRALVARLRSAPETPLAQALADSLGAVHGLNAAQIAAARRALSGELGPDAVLNDRIYNAFMVEDQIYAAGSAKLYQLAKGEWEQVRGIPKGTVRFVAKLGGALYVAGDAGIHVYDGGAWHEIGNRKTFTLLAVNGVLYAGTDKGLYWRDGADWVWDPHLGIESIYDLQEFKGKVYAANSEGLFAGVVAAPSAPEPIVVPEPVKRGVWVWLAKAVRGSSVAAKAMRASSAVGPIHWDRRGPVFRYYGRQPPNPGYSVDREIIFTYAVRQTVVIDDRLHIVAENGIYAMREDGVNWDAVLPAYDVYRLVVLPGGTYALTSRGAYLRSRSGEFHQVFSGTDRVYAMIEKGLMFWVGDKQGLKVALHPPHAWQETLTRDLQFRLEEERARAMRGALDGPSFEDEADGIRDDQGRVVFGVQGER